jgi:ferredoxin
MSPGLEVDSSRCIGSGNCQFLAPATFSVGDDGVSHVVNDDESDEAKIERAIFECPAGAIYRARVQ